MDLLVTLIAAVSELFRAALSLAASLTFALFFTLPANTYVVVGALQEDSEPLALTAPLPGDTYAALVAPGDRVKAGDPLFRFDAGADETELARLRRETQRLDREIASALGAVKSIGRIELPDSAPQREGETDTIAHAEVDRIFEDLLAADNASSTKRAAVAVSAKVSALKAEQKALADQIAAKQGHKSWLDGEIVSLERLKSNGFTSDIQINPLTVERDAVVEEIAYIEQRLSNLDVEIAGLQLSVIEAADLAAADELETRIRTLITERNHMVERIATAEAAYESAQLAAPFAGVVTDMSPAVKAGTPLAAGAHVLTLKPQSKMVTFTANEFLNPGPRADLCVVKLEDLKQGVDIDIARRLPVEADVRGQGAGLFQQTHISFALNAPEIEALGQAALPRTIRAQIGKCASGEEAHAS